MSTNASRDFTASLLFSLGLPRWLLLLGRAAPRDRDDEHELVVLALDLDLDVGAERRLLDELLQLLDSRDGVAVPGEDDVAVLQLALGGRAASADGGHDDALVGVDPRELAHLGRKRGHVPHLDPEP